MKILNLVNKTYCTKYIAGISRVKKKHEVEKSLQNIKHPQPD